MDVVASCAESRDQRRGREKMRVQGKERGGRGESGQEWKGLCFTENHKAQTAPLNKTKVTVFLLGD